MSKSKVSIQELKVKRLEAVSRKKQAEADISDIDAQLMLMVNRGETKEGIIHVFFEKDNPSWKNAFEEVVRELVPKTKHDLAAGILQKNTKHSEQEYIKVEA